VGRPPRGGGAPRLAGRGEDVGGPRAVQRLRVGNRRTQRLRSAHRRRDRAAGRRGSAQPVAHLAAPARRPRRGGQPPPALRSRRCPRDDRSRGGGGPAGGADRQRLLRDGPGAPVGHPGDRVPRRLGALDRSRVARYLPEGGRRVRRGRATGDRRAERRRPPRGDPRPPDPGRRRTGPRGRRGGRARPHAGDLRLPRRRAERAVRRGGDPDGLRHRRDARRSGPVGRGQGVESVRGRRTRRRLRRAGPGGPLARTGACHPELLLLALRDRQRRRRGGRGTTGLTRRLDPVRRCAVPVEPGRDA